jgi:Pyridoxal-dependent decarboxylase conserved domain
VRHGGRWWCYEWFLTGGVLLHAVSAGTAPALSPVLGQLRRYGLVYPGVGWVIWRDEAHLPSEMVFLENYLGTVERSITLNFSKGASQIIGQYYQVQLLGCQRGLKRKRGMLQAGILHVRHA